MVQQGLFNNAVFSGLLVRRSLGVGGTPPPFKPYRYSLTRLPATALATVGLKEGLGRSFTDKLRAFQCRRILRRLLQTRKVCGNRALSKMTIGRLAAHEVYAFGGLGDTDFCGKAHPFGRSHLEYFSATSYTLSGNQKCNVCGRFSP